MPENVNWSAVWQSVTDTWLPLFGGIALIVVAVIVIHIIRKRKNNKTQKVICRTTAKEKSRRTAEVFSYTCSYTAAFPPAAYPVVKGAYRNVVFTAPVSICHAALTESMLIFFSLLEI